MNEKANEKSEATSEKETNHTKAVFAKIEKCTECRYHRVECDPDPDDWFCDDDVKVRCLKSTSGYRGNHCQEPYITVGCRPYRIYEETDVPTWCPLLKEKDTKK